MISGISTTEVSVPPMGTTLPSSLSLSWAARVLWILASSRSSKKTTRVNSPPTTPPECLIPWVASTCRSELPLAPVTLISSPLPSSGRMNAAYASSSGRIGLSVSMFANSASSVFTAFSASASA